VFNILYCFDENYNIQAYCSIISLLNHSNEKVSIYIIHKDPETFEQYNEKIKKHNNLLTLNIYKFDKKDINFPNFKNSHFSNAIFYRLFLESYVPKNIDFVLYIDADAYFIKEYQLKLTQSIEKLKKSNKILSAQTNEVLHNEKNRLNLSSGRYLNSGVLLINYQLWIKNNCSFQLSSILQNRKSDFLWHDQDILSLFFDGSYEELDEDLNFNVYGKQRLSRDLYEKIENDAVVIHYSGKFKPWSPKGIFALDSKYYYDIFRKLFKPKYHIVNVWTPNTLRILIINIFNLKIWKLEYPFQYFKLIISSLNKNINL
tara:strand:+ start:2686 stop:3630 length:945 start_codon:yes stop_codon:yes gene_type:complete